MDQVRWFQEDLWDVCLLLLLFHSLHLTGFIANWEDWEDSVSTLSHSYHSLAEMWKTSLDVFLSSRSSWMTNRVSTWSSDPFRECLTWGASHSALMWPKSLHLRLHLQPAWSNVRTRIIAAPSQSRWLQTLWPQSSQIEVPCRAGRAAGGGRSREAGPGVNVGHVIHQRADLQLCSELNLLVTETCQPKDQRASLASL